MTTATMTLTASDLAEIIDSGELWDLTLIPGYSGYNYTVYGSGLAVRGELAGILRFMVAVADHLGRDIADELSGYARTEQLAGDMIVWFPGVEVDGELPEYDD